MPLKKFSISLLRSYSITRHILSLSMMVSALLAYTAHAQNAVAVDAIQKQLMQLYQTAKPTADGTDLVTAGSVLVLQKDSVLMVKVDQPIPAPNLYKDGKLTQGGLAGAASIIKTMGRLKAFSPFAGNSAVTTASTGAEATREFVTGEKFFVIGINTQPDGVVFNLMSDPIKDQRYHGTLRFSFAKGTPSPDDVAALVSEVIKIDAGDNSQAQSAAATAPQRAGGTPQASSAAPTDTKTIAIGQTRDQVIALFGVPTKIVQLGVKEIDFFPDMKVTFVGNRVADVQ